MQILDCPLVLLALMEDGFLEGRRRCTPGGLPWRRVRPTARGLPMTSKYRFVRGGWWEQTSSTAAGAVDGRDGNDFFCGNDDDGLPSAPHSRWRSLPSLFVCLGRVIAATDLAMKWRE